MTDTDSIKLVYTIEGLCKVCYTCVRECPVKAIRIFNGQAEVIHERCIGCGNCTKVCSQGAKVYYDSKQEVAELLQSNQVITAIVAPSFAAEFTEIPNYKLFVGMLRKLGFDYVNEVAFGADLVAKEYKNLMLSEKEISHISSDCPAIVNYIMHYHPEIADKIARIASPMVAVTRALKELRGNNIKIVFIGPCIAKKAESEEIDGALTFVELRQLFELNSISPEKVNPSDFDQPKAAKGAIFPVSRGLLQTVNVPDNITESKILVAEGKKNFIEAIKEYKESNLEVTHLELLCCDGCIMGPGTSKGGKRYLRQNAVGKYAKEKLENLDKTEWQKYMDRFSSLDLSVDFDISDRRIKVPAKEEIEKELRRMGKFKPEDHLNCGACGYETCVEHAIAIIEGLAESEMCLPYTIESLHKLVDDLNSTNQNLANTKEALKQSEKLASMGQLSAGIAHELNNPLGVITMYANILKEETDKDNPLYNDLELIAEQADRCKNIVGGLLNFARKNQVKLTKVNIEEFCKHSIKSIIVPENIKINFISNIENPIVTIDKDQMMQVLTNLEKNAIEAMPDGGKISLHLSDTPDRFKIIVEDTGQGISKENAEKIFTPFFSTKGIGKGTGLGLPLVYGIVKMHKGKINFVSNDDTENGPTGTKFILDIPRNCNNC